MATADNLFQLLTEAKIRVQELEHRLEISTHHDFDALDTRNVTIEALEKQVKTFKSQLEGVKLFPVELRKMWSGAEVQDWINDILVDKLSKKS